LPDPRDGGPSEPPPIAAGVGLHGPWQTYVIRSSHLTELRRHERERTTLSSFTPDDDAGLQQAIDSRIYGIIEDWLEQQRPDTALWRRKVEVGTIMLWVFLLGGSGLANWLGLLE
jgi:hypothetical protein